MTSGEKAAQGKFPEAHAWFPRLLEIARAHPSDPASPKALIWVVNRNAESDAGREALGLLVRDHVASPGPRTSPTGCSVAR